MKQATAPGDGLGQQLQSALLDYARSPGKYHVALRQPPLLFASVREILQLAAGRGAEAESGAGGDPRALREAACFFARTALLYPGADHYTLLGLQRNGDIAELKERYRLLMRLIHPDFADAASVPWPADAAVRVNLAYEVLASDVQRREYDSRLSAAEGAPFTPKIEHRHKERPARVAVRHVARSRFKWLAIVSGVAGAGAVLVMSLSMLGPDPVHLVQRARAPVANPVQAAVEEASRVVAALPPPRSSDPPATPVEQPQPVPTPLAKSPERPSQPVALSSSLRTVAAPETAVMARQPVPDAPDAPDAPPAPQPPLAATPTQAVAAPAPVPAPVLTPAPPPAPAPVRVARAEPVPAAARPPPVAGPTLAQAQPLLALLLQQLESGQGDRLINLLEREARNKPGAQDLLRQYDNLVGGVRTVRLSQVEFNAEPGDGRLLVTGHIRLLVGESTIGSPSKKMVVRAEFMSRQGTVVMTGLSGVAGN